MSNIQWYPGHMTKAKRNIQADLKLVDLVIEILDARIPDSTRNPDIAKITTGKKRLILMNKSDLADPEVTRAWIEKFKSEGCEAIAMDSRARSGLQAFRKSIERLSVEKRDKDLKKGITGERPVKAMVLGIPNVGKSTLINTLTGKVTAKTGNKPGVTKGNQWVNAGSNLLLLDTPGVLWPKFEDKKTGYNLAATGAINDDILDLSDVSMFLTRELLDGYRRIFLERYCISAEELETELSNCENDIPGLDAESLAMLKLCAMKRSCIKKGAQPDYDRTSKLLLDDFRSGKIGKISLERP